MSINHGEVLKKLMKETKTTAVELAEKLNVHLQSVYLWYRSDIIQHNRILQIADFFNINPEVFYTQNSDPESAVKNELYAAGHQGKKLKLLLEEKQIDLSKFARVLEVSRPTIYKWFNADKLPDDIILKVCAYFNLPTFYFTEEVKPQFKDNDIWRLLSEINSKSDQILSRLEFIEEKVTDPGK